jgi:hypothetical protein
MRGLPLQVTASKKQSEGLTKSLKSVYSYYYRQLGLDVPQLQTCENPLVFFQQIQRGLGTSNKKSFPVEDQQERGRPVNFKLWQFIGENVARPLSQSLANQQDLFKQLQESQAQQQVIHQALTQHLAPQLGASTLPEVGHHPHYFDQQWANLYYQSQIKNEGLEHLLQALHQGLMLAQHFENSVWVCPLPTVAKFDEAGNLHNEDGPALAWPSLAIYLWHGVEIPKKLIEQPEAITNEDVLNEHNAEVRRCYQEVLGAERFAALFELVNIHDDVDRKGNLQVLYRTKYIDDLAKSHIQFAKVICPTTNRTYFLCVPPHLKTIWEAVAWTFGKTPEDYHPDTET